MLSDARADVAAGRGCEASIRMLPTWWKHHFAGAAVNGTTQAERWFQAGISLRCYRRRATSAQRGVPRASTERPAWPGNGGIFAKQAARPADECTGVWLHKWILRGTKKLIRNHLDMGPS